MSFGFATNFKGKNNAPAPITNFWVREESQHTWIMLNAKTPVI